MPKVSIIIPYYNQDEDMLIRCIKSAQSQTYPDHELIIVNDGSDPNHTALLHDSCSQFNNIRLFEQENAGVSAARNLGVSKAEGEYITFLDADDELQPFFLEEAIRIEEETGVDLVIGGVREVTEEEETDEDNGNLEAVVYKDNKTALCEHLIDRLIRYPGGYIGRGPVARLVKRELAARIPFDQGIKIGEDIIWNLRLLKVCDSVAVVRRTWYLYHINPGSATRKFNPEIVQEAADELQKICQVADLEDDSQYLAVCNHIIEELKKIHDCLIWRREWKVSSNERSETVKSLYREEPWNMIRSNRYMRLTDPKGKIKATLYRWHLLFTVWRLAGAK